MENLICPRIFASFGLPAVAMPWDGSPSPTATHEASLDAKNGRWWIRRHGRDDTLSLFAVIPRSSGELPYGVFAKRLLMIFAADIARTGRVITSVTELADRLCAGKGGNVYAAIRNTATALLSTRYWHIAAAGRDAPEDFGGDAAGWLQDRIAQMYGVAPSPENCRLSRGQECVDFSIAENWQEWTDGKTWDEGELMFVPALQFYKMCNDGLPVPGALVEACGRSPLTLDLAAFLLLRLGSKDVKRLAVGGHVGIPLSALARQLGAVTVHPAEFTVAVKAALDRIRIAWPTLRIEIEDGVRSGSFPRSAAIRLWPSPLPSFDAAPSRSAKVKPQAETKVDDRQPAAPATEDAAPPSPTSPADLLRRRRDRDRDGADGALDAIPPADIAGMVYTVVVPDDCLPRARRPKP